MKFKPTASQLKKLYFWRRSTFMVMLIGYVGYYMVRKNLSAAFPLLEKEFQFSNADLGLIALSSEIAYAVGKFINGPLADRFGGRRFFLLGMFGAIVFNLLFTQFGSLVWFAVIWCGARFFLSMGWGGISKTIGARYEPDKNGTVMGLISLNFQFGGVVATLFAGWVVSLGAGWQGVFIYPAAVVSVIFVYSYFFSKSSAQDVFPGVQFPITEKRAILDGHAKEDHEDIKEHPLVIIKKLSKLRIFQILLLFSFLTTYLRSIFFFWTPKLLYDLGLGASSAIFKSALFPALGCIGTIFIGWYTDRYAKNGDRAKMMWLMLLGLTASLVAISFLAKNPAENMDSIVILLGASGFFLLGPYSMSSGCLTLDIAGHKGAGSCTGIIDGIGYLGGALSVWMAGRLSDELGWSQVFVLLAGFAALSMFAAMLMSRHYKKEAKYMGVKS